MEPEQGRPNPGSTPDEPTQRVGSEELQRMIAELSDTASSSGRGRLGAYVLMEELGRGSMGTVQLARHEQLDREVALKILPHSLAGDEGARRRFLREARAMARIEHPNVVRIHDVIEQDGVLAIAMERIEGATLATVLHALREADRSEPSLDDLAAALGTPRESIESADYTGWVTRVGLDLAGALQAVHDAGLTHRDVKPSNVLLDRRGRAHLADFGVVRDPDGSMTRTGGFVGTAVYASPEQLRDSRSIEPAADVYGLGATLYEAISLQPPVSGSPATILDVVQRGAIPTLHRRCAYVHRDLALVVHRALEPEAERRYPTALALAADLQAFADGRAVSVRPTTRLERLALWAKREPARARTAAIACAAVLGLLIVGAYLLAQMPRIESAIVTEQRQEYDELINEGFARLRSSLSRSEFQDRAGAIAAFQEAEELLPDEPIAVGGLALALAMDDRTDEARTVLAAHQELVDRWRALRYLQSTGIELLAYPPDDTTALLDGETDALTCFFAALAARQRAGSSSHEDRQEELMRGAVELLQCAIDLCREPPRVFRATLANAAADVGEVRTARRQIRVLRREWLDPPSKPYPSVALQVAHALVLMGDFESALEVCESEPFGGLPELHRVHLRADVLLGLGRNEEAIRLLQMHTAAPEGRQHVLERLARLHDEAGDTEAASRYRVYLLQELEALVATADAADRAAPSLRLATLDVHQALDEKYDPTPILRELAERFPQAWRIQGRLVYELVQDAGARWLRVMQLRRARREEEAEKVRTEYTALVEEARRASEAATEAAPYHLEVTLNGIRLLCTIVHDYEAALPLMDRMKVIDPDDVLVDVTRGNTLAKLGRYDEAAQVLEEACRHTKADAEALGNLGWCLLELDRVPEAAVAFERCAELARGTPVESHRDWPVQSSVGTALCLLRSLEHTAADVDRARALLEDLEPTWLRRDPALACAYAEALAADGELEGAGRWLAAAERARVESAKSQLLDRARDRILETGRATIDATRERIR